MPEFGLCLYQSWQDDNNTIKCQVRLRLNNSPVFFFPVLCLQYYSLCETKEYVNARMTSSSLVCGVPPLWPSKKPNRILTKVGQCR